jgi:hypothetical protein
VNARPDTPDARRRTPVVPLEAGGGPDNPPCPACGEPLFGWLDASAGLGGPVSRCESCGLGAIGAAGDTGDALEALDRLRSGEEIRILSRAGLAASLGNAGWAGLEPGARYLFTPEAVRRLVANRDQIVTRTRWIPTTGIATTWQSLLNGLTFGRNVALATLGHAPSVPAKRPWQRRLDIAISALAAIPALVVALPLELTAAAVRRGSALRLRVELL